MTDPDLARLLEQNDWAAIERARGQGDAAADVIAPALAATEPERRMLAIQALQAAGGKRAAELLVGALDDAHRQVRAYAVNALLAAPPPKALEARLLVAWDRSKCPTVRRVVPMVLGRMEGAALPPLRTRLVELDEVRDGLLASLARLGDTSARLQLARVLEGARGSRVKSLSALLPYIDQPWLLPHLSPWLERVEVVDIIGSHAGDLKRRACDLAMDEVVRQVGPALELTRKDTYDAASIERAREHLARLDRLKVADAPPE